MAILVVFEDAAVTRAQYDQAHEEVSPDNKLPAGMLCFTNRNEST